MSLQMCATGQVTSVIHPLTVQISECWVRISAKDFNFSQPWWCMPAIPTLRRLKHEYCEYNASQGCMARPYPSKQWDKFNSFLNTVLFLELGRAWDVSHLLSKHVSLPVPPTLAKDTRLRYQRQGFHSGQHSKRQELHVLVSYAGPKGASVRSPVDNIYEACWPTA